MQRILAALFIFMLLMIMGGVFAAYAGGHVWRFQRRRYGPTLARYNPKNIMRRLRKKPAFEVDMPTVRDFVLTLQLSLSLAETLAGALQQAARQFSARGVFGQRLNVRVRSQLQVEPEAVIRALAEDFNSKHLTELADRLDIAHEGALSYSAAVNTTLDDIEEEIRIDVEKEIERAPVMLTIPMIIGVFFSALALLGLPLLVFMMSSVAGAAAG
jgi:hypothetical protein